jgi:hypothetical protein
MSNLATISHDLKQFTKAEELKVIVMKNRKQLLGDDHPDTLHAMANLAVTYWTLKEFIKAEELEVIVLEKRKQLLGDNHPDTLLAMDNLAATYRSLDKQTKAEELERLLKKTITSRSSLYFFPLSHTIFILSNESLLICTKCMGSPDKRCNLHVVYIYLISIMSRELFFFELEYSHYLLHMVQDFYLCPETGGLGQNCCI